MDKFTALADPTRRNILEMLAGHGELSASQISGRFVVSPPAISQHLKVLRLAKLVRMEKRAQKRIYSLNVAPIHEIEEWLKTMRAAWDERFDALAEHLKTVQSTNQGEKA